MNLKPTLLALAVAVAGGAMALAPAAFAADGTITFSGKVLSSTCTVSDGGNVAVTLPDVPFNTFTGAGSVAGLTPFAVSLTGCPTTPSGVVVAAKFDATNVDASTGALTNASGTSNVEVQLTNNLGTAIDLNANDTPVSATIDGTGAATLNYEAQYYQPTATAVTAGTVNTSVDFTLTYN